MHQYSGTRQELLIEQIATRLGAHQSLFSQTPRLVYRITGERDKVPSSPYRATDPLRFLVAEAATSPRARVITKNALGRIVLGPKETITAAASR